jgi:hypothetical protein
MSPPAENFSPILRPRIGDNTPHEDDHPRLARRFSLTLGTAVAQPAPFNEAGVTMGHWHLTSKDVEADKKLFLAMGGKLYMPAACRS